MAISLKDGRVLLVGGPAAVLVRAGRVSILGAEFAAGRRIVIRRGKSIPFQALQDSALELVEGEGSTRTEFPDSTIPESWSRVVEEVLARRLSPIVVLGATDRGKNTFCLYLSNMFLKRGLSVALIDGDVGQSDVGPPGGVSTTRVSYPTFDLFNLRPEATVFIGSTSPSGVQNRILEALSGLCRAMKELDLILINTDGWVLGDDAVEYKLRVLSSIDPNAIVGIQFGCELEPILSIAESRYREVFRVETSTAASPRDRSVRKGLREQCYRKFLRGSVLRKLFIDRVKLVHTFLSSLEADSAVQDQLSKLVQCPIMVHTGADGRLYVLAECSGDAEKDRILKAVETIDKPVKIVVVDEMKGLLLAFIDGRGGFLGLGVMRGIDFLKRTLEVLTPCNDAPNVISFGRIRLDDELREIGITEAFEL